MAVSVKDVVKLVEASGPTTPPESTGSRSRSPSSSSSSASSRKSRRERRKSRSRREDNSGEGDKRIRPRLPKEDASTKSDDPVLQDLSFIVLMFLNLLDIILVTVRLVL